MDTLGISLPGNISGWLGTIRVDISGNETLQSIYDAIVAAGFGDYVYKDSSIFAIKGTLRVASGTTGSLTIINTVIYIIEGTIANDSTSFTWQFGSYDATTDTASSGCKIYHSGNIDFFLQNIKAYACDFVGGINNISNWITIGTQISGMNTNIKYCDFWFIRNTSTDWSNNKLLLPIMSRAWGNITITNTYYDSIYDITYYPINGCNIFYDSTFKINLSTYALSMYGYAGYNYIGSAQFYDCTFTGAYYNSPEDLKYYFSSWESIQNFGFEFLFSLNGSVLDIDGNGIPANIKCYDKDGVLKFDINCDVNGAIPKTYITTLRVKPTGNGTSSFTKTISSPFTFIITANGYETYTTKYAIASKQTIAITLKTAKPTGYAGG